MASSLLRKTSLRLASVASGRQCTPSLSQAQALLVRTKSSQPVYNPEESVDQANEYIKFPTSTDKGDMDLPVLLNSKEHAIGYLSKILNARVYDVAVETKLQHAKNLSAVRKCAAYFYYQLYPSAMILSISMVGFRFESITTLSRDILSYDVIECPLHRSFFVAPQ